MDRKLVRVTLEDVGYTVYADDPEMIEDAMTALTEDLFAWCKYDELGDLVCVVSDDPSLKEADVPEFLLGDDDEDQD